MQPNYTACYNNGTSSLENGDPLWYQPYVDYALENGIIPTGYANYNAKALRSDFAMIFAAAFPEEALTPINTIDDGAVPDVTLSYTYGPDVYLLYRSGVLTGSGDNHAFLPNNNIKRSEVAAIVARMADSSFRVSFSISGQTTQELTSTQIAAHCSPAVFMINIYDASGQQLGTGSGFFIDESGLAVTNYHVVEKAYTADIVMPDEDGTTYDVAGIYDYSKPNDFGSYTNRRQRFSVP